MTSRDFIYWLQGYLEIGKPASIEGEQLDVIRRHLAMVFTHEIDPSVGDKEHQEKLDHIHNNPPGGPVYRC